MQHHGCSWYLPWGIPLQKMISMPMQQNGETAAAAAAAATLSPYANATSNMQCTAASPTTTCQILTQQHQPATNAAISLQAQTQPHHFQHHPGLHTANGTQVAVNAGYSFPSTAATLHHNTHASHQTVLNNQLHTHLQNFPQFQNVHGQILHPAAAAAAAAAAMFTPLSLRTFLAATSNPTLAGVATQPALTPCLPTVNQQNPNLLATAATPTAATQQLNCMTSVLNSAQQQHHQHQQQQQQQQQQQAQQQHQQHQHTLQHHMQQLSVPVNLNIGILPVNPHLTTNGLNKTHNLSTIKKLISPVDKDKLKISIPEKRKAEETEQTRDLKKAKLETKALKAKRPGFTDERYQETSYYLENGLRKVYPYYFTFTTFTKGRWVGEKILDVFAREFRAHPAEEYERCIKAGTLTVNYEKVPIDYRLKHNDLLANIVHRHEVPVTSQPITIVHMDEDIVVVNKPASIPVHPCGRYRHNTVVFILAKEYNLKNLRTIHRLDRLTSGLLLFGRSPKKARQMEQQIRNRQVHKEYVCRVDGNFPEGVIECKEPIEVVSYKIGVCKVSPKGKDCTTTFQKIAHNGNTSVVLCKPLTGRMHQIRVHLQYLGYPIVNDPLYNHEVFGPLKGRGGDIGGKTDEELIRDLINIHNAENWLGIDGDSEISLFKSIKGDDYSSALANESKAGNQLSDDDSEIVSRETTPPCAESPQPNMNATLNDYESPMVSNSPKEVPLDNGDAANITQNEHADAHAKITTVATQTGHEDPDMVFNASKMTSDRHCYECKVHYRDPKPKDLVMYLHAWKYKGPGWEYETELPSWAKANWQESVIE